MDWLVVELLKYSIMETEKIKLLSLTNCVLEYRIPVYNLLSETFDVTVAHYGKMVPVEKAKFKQIILSPKKRGPFTVFKEDIEKIASNYDSVIALGDLHIWPYIKLGFLKKRKFSLSYWTIGVSASYNKRFDEDRKLDKIRFFLMNRADSIVFYTDYPIKRYVEDGKINESKLFVANNTVEIKNKIEIPSVKKHFLFVGTLYRAKKVFDLLDAYLIAFQKNKTLPPLLIVGDGEEKRNIEIWIAQNNLTDKIVLKGAIFDQNILREYYKDAIACISPGQAGLTVLNAMAYGTPFVTTENAITGGEIFNIDNNVNGIIYKENIKTLAEIIIQLSTNTQKVKELSYNAQEYYFNNRTIQIMVRGLVEAIVFAKTRI